MKAVYLQIKQNVIQIAWNKGLRNLERRKKEKARDIFREKDERERQTQIDIERVGKIDLQIHKQREQVKEKICKQIDRERKKEIEKKKERQKREKKNEMGIFIEKREKKD